MKTYSLLTLVLFLGGVALSACQPATAVTQNTPVPTQPSAPTEPPAPTENPDPWQTVGEHTVKFQTLLVGFENENYGITIGEHGEVHYTTDAGANWPRSENTSAGLYGLDILDAQTAWSCGGMGMRFTSDGGQTWQEASVFGGGVPSHCRFLSFSDDQVGWAATAAKLGTTADAGMTWNEAILPDGVDTIAAISQFAPEQGYLLDVTGKLYSTADNAQTWTSVGELPLDNIEIQSMNYPVTAMRFFDTTQGMVVIAAIVDGKAQVTAFRTRDAGQTWTKEIVLEGYGIPYLSRDGKTLTLFSLPYKATVLQYHGEE